MYYFLRLPLDLRDRFRAVLRDFAVVDFRDLRRDGTFAPFSRASLRPIAIACLRLRTLRPEPLRNVPRFRRRIADSTFFFAPRPYFAMLVSLRRLPSAPRSRRMQRKGQ